MKTLAWSIACALLLSLPAAHAQQVLAASSAPPPPALGSGLPPPGINDAGTPPASAPAKPARGSAPVARPVETAAAPENVPLPDTGIPPSIAPAAREAEGHGDSTNVPSRTDAGGNTLQETGRGGHVNSVKYTPNFGVTQIYHNNNPDGSLVRDPNLGPVTPVYYDIYTWGAGPKPRRNKAASSAPPKSAKSQPASSSG